MHRHRQVLRDFIQTEETCLGHGAGLQIFADLRSYGAAEGLVEGGEGIQGGLVICSFRLVVGF